MQHPVGGPTVTLRAGNKMPVLGLGTWKSSPGEVEAAVSAAIDVGYRHIDCAWIYGNQKEVGTAVKKAVAAGKVKREELFIVSKLWNAHHHPELARQNIKESLDDLGLDYLDLYLIHWPVAFAPNQGNFPKDANDRVLWDNPSLNLKMVWGAMEEFQKAGKARAIGVSNFTIAQMEEISQFASVPISVNQVELTPYFVRNKLSTYCASKGIILTAFSPLGSPDRPAGLVPEHAKEKNLLEDPRVKEIAKRHGKSVAQVLIRYHIDKGRTVIPKSAKKERLTENYEALKFVLPASDIAALDAMDENLRMVEPPWMSYCPHPLND
eukprot:Mycagemm_TRINITY_DN11687_c0_g1::TRINITY_DN11687_c0_g1_i1::g.2808::m.2808 type:complete len:323 gc:universal TRINITY_DN11687_c0_g1_i1:978-10(-)